MTAVWTAMSLQRSDIDSNTLSRSLGSLMIPPVDDEYNATVVLHSNMATEPPLSTTESHSRGSTDAETQSSAPFVRQVSAPNPQFQKLITNSASSVTFLGKRITREYQSHFVLPDKQMVAVTRKETFLPEEAHSEVTLSLSLAGPPELADKTRLDNFGRVNKRIFDYLDPGDWASAILASSESRDAELLGRLGSKYSSSVARKTHFERSASRKSREEIVMAREFYSEDEEEEDDIVLNEEEELMGHVDNAMHISVGDDDTQRSVKRTFQQSPVDSDKEFNSSKFTHLSSFDHTSLVRPTPSRMSSHLTQSKSLDITPPIIARSDQPGIKVKPLSDVRSRLNFEELRRKWDERVAREQSHLDEQWEYGQGGEAQSGKLKHHEGHRGSAVTSILPTIDRKLRSGDERNRSKSFVVERDQTLMSDSASKTRFLVNRTNTLPDRAYKPGHAPRSPPGSDQNEQYSQSPHSVLSEPVTDREEKDAKFLYTHEKLRVGQENIGYLSPLSRGSVPFTSHIPRHVSIKTRAFNWFQSDSQQFNCPVFDDVLNTNASHITFDKLDILQTNTLTHENEPDNVAGNGFTKTSITVMHPGRSKDSKEQKIKYIYRSTFSRLPIGIRSFRKRAHSADETHHWLSRTKTSRREFHLSHAPNLTIDWSTGQDRAQTLPTASKCHYRTQLSMIHTPISPNTISLDDSESMTQSEQIVLKKDTITVDWRDEIQIRRTRTRAHSWTSIPTERKLEGSVTPRLHHALHPYSQLRPFEVKIIPKSVRVLPFDEDRQTPTDVTMKRSTGQFDQYKHERPCVPPRLYGTTSVDKTGSVDTNEVHPVLPPRPQEITGDYKGNGKPDVKLYDKKHLTRGFTVEQVDDILSDQSVKGQSIHISPLSKESATKFRDDDVRRPTDILGRPKKKMPPPPRSDHPKQVEHKPKNELFKIPHKENVKETEFSHNNFVCTPEPERPALPTEMKFKHVDVPATPMGRLVQVDSKVHEKSSQSHRKPTNVLVDPDKATAHADVKTIDNRILDTRRPSGNDLDHPGHDNEHDDRLELLAPQPYKNRYSVPSIELGQFVGGGSKPNDMGSASRRKPRPASIASVPVDSRLTGNKAEPKLLRRRSHLDRRLDEQIDKVYSEELIRRASLPPDRGLSVDRDSSSGLSALATYEEHQRARQIEDILKPGRSTEKHRLPTQTSAGKHTDKSKSSSIMKLIGVPSKDISLPSQSEDQVSKSIHPKMNEKDRQMNQDHGRPKYSGQEKIGRKRTFEPKELQQSPTADLVRDEAKKMPFTQPNSVVQSKSKSPAINATTDDRKRHSTDPTELAESKFSSPDELNVRKSRFPPSDDNRHRPNSTTKADCPKSSDVINLKSPSLTRSKVKGDLKRTESSREPIQCPNREPSAAQLDNNEQKRQKHLENQDEITAIELGKGDERKPQGNLGKMKKDLPSVQRSLSGRGAVESHHGLNKRRTLDASDLKRFIKGDKSSENPDNVEARELDTQKRPRSIDGRRPLKDRNPLAQRISHPKSSRPEGRLTEYEPTKNKSVHQIDPTEHSFPSEKPPIRRAQSISTSSRSSRTGSSDEVTRKRDRSRRFESLELDRPEKQRHQAKKKPIGTPSSRVSPGTEPTRTKQKCSERSPNENVRKKPVTDRTASLYDPYDSSAGKSPQLHGRNQDTTKGASIKRTQQDQGEGTYKQKPEDEALSEKQYGHKRHPPPPTSPPMRYSANAGDERQSETFESHRRRSSAAKQDNTESISGQMSSKNSSQKLSNKEADHVKRSSYPSRASDTHKSLETSKSVDPAKRGSPYPDEYDIHNETGPRKHATKGGQGPRIFSVTSSGEQRKRPESQIQDQQTSGMAKEKKTSRKARHLSPPKPPVQRAESKPKIEDERPRPRHRPRHRMNQTMDEDTEPTYVNVGGSIPNGSEPWEEEWTKKSPEFSERSNEHSSYDPRVNDQGALKARRPAHRPPPPPPPTTTFPSGSTSRSQENREGGRHPKRAPEAAPRSQPTAKLEESREAYHDDDDDDDDLEDSECDLKPPPLRISQTKKYSESIVPSQRYSGDSTKQHRASSRGSQQMSKPQPSIRGSLVSPGGMSASSLPHYFPGGPLDKVHSGGPYRPEQFHPHHYEQIPHERPSRPRSKRITATSQDLAPPGVSGSKHSLIISTKRRTLSGVTGTNPVKQRSKSMNELWFGDHPVPSSGALSPNAPLRLSNIQLQAQAELERRHRSSSHAHSLDRRSGLSYGHGPESHASGAPADVEGYEGVGYGYDTRGRLIHGGAPLHERAVSRKRRLLDGHESLSRVWIPQSAAGSTVRSDDVSLSAATRLSERKAHLDDSAVAFALRDFTSAGAR
ncbi:hypothetical protein D915_003728 [Fasciola hepatica]|uniref:Uncharacterized protein n=1 Tax=Fasciola hepatica TaxID=6192 RepID=A0A4E0RCW1_FASHE|nr:hypothetical protein D915_003728 [Fasciola hepatica]